MLKIMNLSLKKQIPFLLNEFYVDYDGNLFNSEDELITIEQFNECTRLNVELNVLQLVCFHNVKLAPSYWSEFTTVSPSEGFSLENSKLALNKPCESREYSGFYVIPYYSNYVISECGVLIKKSTGELITASKAVSGYFTFRMTSDFGDTSNRLRHRILGYAFKRYSYDVDDLDINHINGVRGDDFLDNLEWCTRQENMEHAYSLGLRNDNKDVEVRDVNNKRIYVFYSCSQAGRFLNVTETTISNRAKTNGYKVFSGMQFRFKTAENTNNEWPEVESVGSFLATFPDGTTKQCDGTEAAKLAGVSRGSLGRLLREGRNKGKTEILISKI